jgi:hypothetical protein
MRAYDGTASNVTYEYGLGFTPDFVWLKNRDITRNHRLVDSTRGATKHLIPNLNNAESNTSNNVASFDSGGFTVNTAVSSNEDGKNFVAWCLKANGGTTSSNTDGSVTSTVQANQDAGFSIVKWSGNSLSGTVGHGLSQAPEFILIKTLDTTANWLVIETLNNSGGYLDLSNSFTTARYTDWLNSSNPSSTTIPLGAYSYTNGTNMIMYCFHSVDGFSKIGTYTGDGADNGPIIETGFEPAFLMIKRTNGTQWWLIFDNKRSTTNPRNKILYPNESNDEDTTTSNSINFYTNGFQPVGTGGASVNANGGTYIYMAFAADPDTEAPTVAKSFNAVTYTGDKPNDNSITGLGFAPSLVWIKNRDAADSHSLFDIVRGEYALESNTTSSESDFVGYFNFDSDGFTVGNSGQINESGDDFVAWAWKADDNEPTINEEGSIDSIVSANANAGFSIVKWTGDGSASATVGHNLSAKPDMVIIKDLTDSGGWNVCHVGLASNEGISLNSTAAAFTSMGNNGGITNANLSATTFGFATGAVGVDSVNKNGNEYIAYCFHSVSSYSKFGSYAGNGTTQTITTGFQPDFVMMKAYTASTSNTSWTIIDSVRYGSSSDTNPIYANLSAAEGTRGSGSGDGDVLEISFTSTGFKLGDTGSDNGSDEMNDPNNDYIYMAFKIN